MKKPSKSKRLLVSTEKVRDLRSEQLDATAGGCGHGSYDPLCAKSLAGGCGHSYGA